MLAANRWGDLFHALQGWSNERKDGPLDEWKPSISMISATINFAVVPGWLQDRSDEQSEEEPEEEEYSEDEGAGS